MLVTKDDSPTPHAGGNRLQSLHNSKSTQKKQNTQIITVSTAPIDTFFEANLKDYDKLLNFCMQLIDENNQLIAENLELQNGIEENIEITFELLEENRILQKDKDKMVDDNLTVNEFNEQLLKEKAQRSRELNSLQQKMQKIMESLSSEAKTNLIQNLSNVVSLE